jgi:hypothetical protein
MVFIIFDISLFFHGNILFCKLYSIQYIGFSWGPVVNEWDITTQHPPCNISLKPSAEGESRFFCWNWGISEPLKVAGQFLQTSRVTSVFISIDIFLGMGCILLVVGYIPWLKGNTKMFALLVFLL